jgi:hypothetical protein
MLLARCPHTLLTTATCALRVGPNRHASFSRTDWKPRRKSQEYHGAALRHPERPQHTVKRRIDHVLDVTPIPANQDRHTSWEGKRGVSEASDAHQTANSDLSLPGDCAFTARRGGFWAYDFYKSLTSLQENKQVERSQFMR